MLLHSLSRNAMRPGSASEICFLDRQQWAAQLITLQAASILARSSLNRRILDFFGVLPPTLDVLSGELRRCLLRHLKCHPPRMCYQASTRHVCPAIRLVRVGLQTRESHSNR